MKTIVAIRALPAGGFRVVVNPKSGQELWEIDPAGASTLVGAYPAAPAGYSADVDSGRIDPSGALFQIAHSNSDFVDIVVRRQIGGASEIIYTEKSKPLVKLHISALLTGP